MAQLGTNALQHPDRVPSALTAVPMAQFREAVADVEWILKRMPHAGPAQRARLAARDPRATPPPQDHRASLWYRLRWLSLDLVVRSVKRLE